MAYNIKNKTNKEKPSKPCGRGINLFPELPHYYFLYYLYLNIFIFKYTPSTKYNKPRKEIKKYGPFKVKKNKNKSTEVVPEKDLMTGQLDIKTTVIKLIKKTSKKMWKSKENNVWAT